MDGDPIMKDVVPVGYQTDETTVHGVHARPQKNRPHELREFLLTAFERFKRVSERETPIRIEALRDVEFRAGEQWPPDIKAQRQIEGRPCETVNRMNEFLRQVTNEQRQMRPAIQINPVGDGADLDTAEILQGIIRHIEIDSSADEVYDMSFEHMATCGFGWYRIVTEYSEPQTFSKNQCIKIRPISNQFTVYVDDAAVKPDRSDANWAFIVSVMTPKDYRATFPKTRLASIDDFKSVGDEAASWANTEEIRVAEYFYVEEGTRIIYKLTDGSEISEDEMLQMEDVDLRPSTPMGTQSTAS